MSACLAVCAAECKTQMRRPALWIVFALTSALMLWEMAPIPANFARLTDLPSPAYAAARAISQSTPVFALLAVLLAAGRFDLDLARGRERLAWTTPGLRPWIYVLGKFLGNALAFGMLPGGLALLVGGLRLALFPQGFALTPYLLAWLLLGLLPLAYMLGLALALGVLLGQRVASIALVLYILWGDLFATPALDGAAPVYKLVGDLYFLVNPYHDGPYAAAQAACGLRTLAFEALALLACLLGLGIAARLARSGRFARRRLGKPV